MSRMIAGDHRAAIQLYTASLVEETELRQTDDRMTLLGRRAECYYRTGQYHPCIQVLIES